MGVKVSFQIGNRRHVGRNADQAATTEFVNALGAEVRRKAADNVSVNVQKLRTRLDAQIKQSIGRGMTFAARNLMGIKSGIDDKNETTNIVVDWADDQRNFLVDPRTSAVKAMKQPQYLEWKPLAPRTIAEKSKRGMSRENARKFFIDSKALQSEVLGLAKTVTQKTGTVQILYKRDETTRSFSPLAATAQSRRVGQLRLKFLPNIPVRAMTGLQNANFGANNPNMLFESSLGLSSESVKKLQGHYISHRPLLQPVFTYWILNRIPRIVAGAIAQSITDVRDIDRRNAGRNF